MRAQYDAGGADRSADYAALQQAGYSDEQIAIMLPVADAPVELPPVELLAENWPYWQLWQSLRTQWRVSMNGPYGLDYAVLTRDYVRAYGIKKRDYRQALELMRECEAVALDEIAARQQKDN